MGGWCGKAALTLLPFTAIEKLEMYTKRLAHFFQY
jgi:hypothetical protein